MRYVLADAYADDDISDTDLVARNEAPVAEFGDPAGSVFVVSEEYENIDDSTWCGQDARAQLSGRRLLKELSDAAAQKPAREPILTRHGTQCKFPLVKLSACLTNRFCSGVGEEFDKPVPTHSSRDQLLFFV